MGPAANPTTPPRLDGLEIYARPKSEVVAEAATAAEAEADRSVDITAARDAIGLAAIALPGHLAVPSPEQTCCTYVMSQALLTMTSLHESFRGTTATSCAAYSYRQDMQWQLLNQSFTDMRRDATNAAASSSLSSQIMPQDTVVCPFERC